MQTRALAWSRGVRGERGGGLGGRIESGLGRAWRGATFCSCHRGSSGRSPRPPPPSLPGNFFQQPPLGWSPPPPSPPQLSSLTPRLSSGAQRNLSLSINFEFPVNAAPPLAPTPPFQLCWQEGLGHWQNPLREPADQKCQLCVLGPVKSLSSAQALRRPVHGSQGSPETNADTDHPSPTPPPPTTPHLARKDEML
ncbi:unnamed protein product, partial [Rangifer tarandus platyrhynchus]